MYDWRGGAILLGRCFVTKTFKGMIAGALALGTLGLAATETQAMPMPTAGMTTTNVDTVALVCGPYRCFYRRPIYRRYYRPYYRPFYRRRFYY